MLLGCCVKHQLAQRGCVNGIHNCQARKSQADPGHQKQRDFHVFWELTRFIRLRGGRNTSIRWETNDFLSDQPFAVRAYVERQRSFSLVSKLIGVCKEFQASLRLGYEYREYKNWRGVPKPRRRRFCKSAKVEIRKAKPGFQRVCPKCGASGPKRESQDEALRAWSGRS
jgi:hypothetical protein